MRRLSERLRPLRSAADAPSPARRFRGGRRRFLLPRRLAAWGGAGLLLCGAALAFWQTGLAARLAADALAGAVALSARAGFVVEAVYAEGRQETPREAVLEALGVEPGQPIIAFDPDAAKARLEALGWIRAASVQRQWPDALYVRLIERHPMARWRDEGRLVLVDRDGAVIGPANDPRFAGLPLIVGAGAPAAAPALFDLLAGEPDLFARVAACVRVGERRWNLQFDDGVAVMLPEEGVARAWAQFARLVREARLLDKAVVAVDLRLADRLVLRLTPEAADGLADSGRSI